MEVKYNCEQLGCFKVSFKSFRKVAVKLNIKYLSLHEGAWIEARKIHKDDFVKEL
ncbi:U exon, partial [Ovine mastadenovirus A]|uniref:U exon n=1 Tax=Ovine mastadenovirus A TaxID=114424 RepID=UPI00001D968B